MFFPKRLHNKQEPIQRQVYIPAQLDGTNVKVKGSNAVTIVSRLPGARACITAQGKRDRERLRQGLPQVHIPIPLRKLLRALQQRIPGKYTYPDFLYKLAIPFEAKVERSKCKYWKDWHLLSPDILRLYFQSFYIGRYRGCISLISCCLIPNN